MKTKVAVLGAGSWGTALALLLARNHHDVVLWGKDAEQMASMQDSGFNAAYLPEIPLDPTIQLTANLKEALAEAEQVLIVIPSHAYNEFLPSLAPLLPQDLGVASASKGFCQGQCLHQLMQTHLGERPVAIISGPSFAVEVARDLPTAVVVASPDAAFAAQWSQLLNNKNFRPYLSADLIGVEIAGSLKNVLAIATGIAAGLKLGSNTQAALITRGLAEITRLGLAMNAQRETFMGLAGVGDLVLTCTDNQSRNRRFGFALGAGQTVDEAKRSISQVIEGIETTQEARALAQKFNVEMPVIEQVYDVIFKKLPINAAMERLLARDLRFE